MPILLSMAMIALPAALVYGNALHRVVAGVPMYSDITLHGVQNPVAMPELTLHSVLSGAFARDAALSFGRNFPLLAAAVRAKGQVYWSLLHQSPTWYIVIGQNDVLYSTDYLTEYCSRDIAGFIPIAQNWANRLARIQQFYASQHKVFLYVLTPSKASIEPEYIPSGWPCAASPHDQRGLHAAYRKILDQAGVNFVDAVDTTLQAKREFPFPPYPQGGIHFNAAASARAVQALIAKLNEASGWRRLDDFSFTWQMAPPSEVDTDLLDALNVPYTGMHYETPSLTLSPATTEHCVPVVMAAIGGSFSYELYRVLQRVACPPHIDLYEYYRNRMAFYPGDRRYPVDPARRAWMLLDAAEVVVLEENEEQAARSDHGNAFYQLVAQRLQAPK